MTASTAISAANSPGKNRLHTGAGRLCVTHADNHLLFTEEGREYVDLLCGFGTAFLGHANSSVKAAVNRQLTNVWTTGRLTTPVTRDAHSLVENFFPPTHFVASLYSTGMEAAEFAIRAARVATNRPGVVGFDKSTHGKSTATAGLGWQSDLIRLPDVHRLPFLPDVTEEETLERLPALLATESIAAVFVEPLHGSGGGHMGSPAYYQQVSQLCEERGTLCIFDEIFTGFHRTGHSFCFDELGVMPDVILIGKTMGNGFPVSGVVMHRKFPIDRRMFPGSTFADNPLAAAAVAGTLREMNSLPMQDLTQTIGQTISAELGQLEEGGFALRGRGALWILEMPTAVDSAEVATEILNRGVLVSAVGSWIRLLPPATIPGNDLARACSVIRTVCLEARSQRVQA